MALLLLNALSGNNGTSCKISFFTKGFTYMPKPMPSICLHKKNSLTRDFIATKKAYFISLCYSVDVCEWMFELASSLTKTGEYFC